MRGGAGKGKAGRILCAVLSILLVGVLVFMFYTETREEKTKAEAIQAIQEEAAPYEQELRELESELGSLQDEFAYSSEEAEILVGFVVSEASDVDDIAEMAATWQFSPILILDCTMETEDLDDILAAADESWEIMLYAPAFLEEVNEDVLSVISHLESQGKEYAGVFFLRSDYSSEANIQLLKEDGFIGYNRVTAVDIIQDKVDLINRKKSPITPLLYKKLAFVSRKFHLCFRVAGIIIRNSNKHADKELEVQYDEQQRPHHSFEETRRVSGLCVG